MYRRHVNPSAVGGSVQSIPGDVSLYIVATVFNVKVVGIVYPPLPLPAHRRAIYTSLQDNVPAQTEQRDPIRRLPKPSVPGTQSTSTAEPEPATTCGRRVAEPVDALLEGLDFGRVAGSKEDAQLPVGTRRIYLLRGPHWVLDLVARGPPGEWGDGVGDADGHVKDGIVGLAVEAEVLADGDLVGSVSSGRQSAKQQAEQTHIIHASHVAQRPRLPVTYEAVGPHPVDVLDGAIGLLEHDVT